MNFTRAILGLIGWCILCAASTYAQTAPSNVIIIVSDDQGYGDFSAHGNPVLKTPNLDRLRSRASA